MNAKRKFIFLLGPSYSGSTLLTFLLSKHPQIATIGELKATSLGDIEKYRCSCGQLIRECDFWRSVGEECESLGVDFSVDNFDTKLRANGGVADRFVNTAVRGPVFEMCRQAALTLLPGARRALTNSLRRNSEITEVVCRLQGKDVFLDGSKTPSRLLHLAQSGLWDLNVICIQRDGRGVSNSNRKHMETDMRRASETWVRDTREIQRVLGELRGVPVIQVRYEDLCQTPESVLSCISDAFGLSRSDLAGDALMDGEHHILGNSMRLGSVSEIRFDTRWQTELSPEDLAAFDAVAGPLNLELGYE